MTTFRRDYIRDLVDTSTNPYTYYSNYNRATKTQFFLDAAIDAAKTRVETDYAEELTSSYNAKYYERIGASDDVTTADTRAQAEVLDATMRLVRAECREMMMTDPGYRASFADTVDRAALFAVWAVEIGHDRTFEKLRSGSFGAITLARF
jgi:hypothetical protein